MRDYGVLFDTVQPERFDRAQVFVRVAIIIFFSILAGAFGWVLGLLYLGIPVLAAILISQKGADRYLAESGESMSRWLRYIVAFYAYLTLLTDRFPTGDSMVQEAIRFDINPSGAPTPGNALLRLVLALPSAVVLAILWLIGAVLVLIAGVSILLQETYPAGIYDFLRGLNRWQARLLAYLASLVEDYPPFSLDTGGPPGTRQLPGASQ
jgi:hypothetical protein